MGGYGSGRYKTGQRKTTVEECWFIDINELTRIGLYNGGVAPVFVKSKSALGKEKIGGIPYSFKLVKNNQYRIYLRLKENDDGGGEYTQLIHLQFTKLRSGGLRWWFTCPLRKASFRCNRRVGMLYLPPEKLYFGCRHCYDLTYRSCQESHMDERFYERIAERIPGATLKIVKKALRRKGF